MRLEFTYTPEDFDEWAQAPKPSPWKRAGRLKRGLVGWLMFAGLATMLVNLLAWRDGRPAAPPADTWKSLALSFLPWVLVFGFIWIIVYRHLRR